MGIFIKSCLKKSIVCLTLKPEPHCKKGLNQFMHKQHSPRSACISFWYDESLMSCRVPRSGLNTCNLEWPSQPWNCLSIKCTHSLCVEDLWPSQPWNCFSIKCTHSLCVEDLWPSQPWNCLSIKCTHSLCVEDLWPSQPWNCFSIKCTHSLCVEDLWPSQPWNCLSIKCTHSLSC